MKIRSILWSSKPPQRATNTLFSVRRACNHLKVKLKGFGVQGLGFGVEVGRGSPLGWTPDHARDEWGGHTKTKRQCQKVTMLNPTLQTLNPMILNCNRSPVFDADTFPVLHEERLRLGEDHAKGWYERGVRLEAWLRVEG